MTPQGTRVWRKTRRRVLRGIPAGRRTTHAVQTTYGRGQRDAEHRARWAEARTAELEAIAFEHLASARRDLDRIAGAIKRRELPVPGGTR